MAALEDLLPQLCLHPRLPPRILRCAAPKYDRIERSKMHDVDAGGRKCTRSSGLFERLSPALSNFRDIVSRYPHGRGGPLGPGNRLFV